MDVALLLILSLLVLVGMWNSWETRQVHHALTRSAQHMRAWQEMLQSLDTQASEEED